MHGGMFWEIQQHRKTAEAQERVSEEPRQTPGFATEIRDLRSAVDKLMLINRALWEFLRSATNLTDEDLVAKVSEIDLRDGVLDGKLTKRVRTCPACARTLYQGHRHCLYCGAEDPEADPFDVTR